MITAKYRKKNIILAMHSTNDFFGFAFKELDSLQEEFFIKRLEQDLSNNLVSDLNNFLSQKLNSITRISISIGPSNFNASRQIVVCARAISQQMKCSLDNYSSFQIMAKRIAKQNKILKNQAFWISKKLKLKGYLAGKYEIINEFKENPEIIAKELIRPKLFKDFQAKENQFNVNYDIKNDLKELLELSKRNHKNAIFNSWEHVLPLYPISPIN
tara:strand:+ start:1462 stop:2103 length:642 start_codon:yes stop_codon:yes gene_type:complete